MAGHLGVTSIMIYLPCVLLLALGLWSLASPERLFGAGAASTAPGSGSRGLSRTETQRLDRELRSLLGLGVSTSEARLQRLEDELRPTFEALPKNADGTMNPSTTSYALHRHFATSKGWRFKSLTYVESEEDSHSTVTLLKGQVSDAISHLLEAHAVGEATGLEDLALMVAVLEDVVGGESMDLLLRSYEWSNLSTWEPLDVSGQEKLIMVFCYEIAIAGNMSRLSGEEPTIEHIQERAKKNDVFQSMFLWAVDVLETMKFQDRTARMPFAASSVGDGGADDLCSFAMMARWSDRVLAGMGMAQKRDCDAVRTELLEVEGVDEADASLDVDSFFEHHFKETGNERDDTEGILRHVGALDTRRGKDYAVIANYLLASEICLHTPTMLSLCCFNECNVLMSALERAVARPAAGPQHVASAVMALPSTTVAAPRNLSSALHLGLDRIAAAHGGQVPLHSKAFAVWMHRAFPAECPNPALPGADHAPWVGEAFVHVAEASDSGFMTRVAERRHAYDGEWAVEDLIIMGEEVEEQREKAEVAAAPQPADGEAAGRPTTRRRGPVANFVRCLAMVGAVGGFLGSLGWTLASALGVLSAPAKAVGAQQQDGHFI